MTLNWLAEVLGWLRDNASWLSSVVLVGVTAWYAMLTRSIAKSSAAATESARVAAEHSATAAAATVAGLDIRLVLESYQVNVRPDAGGNSVGYLGVSVRCEGASIFIHSGWITEILWEGRAGGRKIGIGRRFRRGFAWICSSTPRSQSSCTVAKASACRRITQFSVKVR